jgi:hypothetical protein
VYLIEMDDEVEVDTTVDELGISLHAFTGIDVTNTMKLHISINSKLVALVDTSSTHTFIKEGLLSQLGLEVTPQDGLTVKVANGEQVTSGGGLSGSSDDRWLRAVPRQLLCFTAGWLRRSARRPVVADVGTHLMGL